jgi:hypothetical protein
MPFDGTDFQKPSEMLPIFRARLWSMRLDFRPVIWSLLNRSEEWAWSHQGCTIVHSPSKHVFWVGNGRGHYALRSETECGCSRSRDLRAPWRDQFAFHRAFRAWERRQLPNMVEMNRRFSSHFLTAKP